jgi:hypothetical protein
MTIYQYTLTCGHRKITPDWRLPGTTIRCNSCAARGWSDQHMVDNVKEIDLDLAAEEESRG